MRAHPLFFAGAVVAVCLGRGLMLLALTLTALIHEWAHGVVAEGRGYALGKITLMPYGAMIDGDVGEMSAKDEVAIALAGPCANLFLVVCVVALWWLFPDLYPYTELVFTANASMVLCNLLPVYPLDGGRVLSALLRSRCGAKGVKKITFAVGCCTAVGLSALLFFAGLKRESALAFLLFLFTLPKKDAGKYAKIVYSPSQRKLKKGAPLNSLVFSDASTLSDVIRRMHYGECYRIFVRGRVQTELNEEEVYRLAQVYPLYEPLSGFIYSARLRGEKK